MKLFEINAAIRELLEAAVDPATGEFNPDALDTLETLELAWREKMESVVLYYKECVAEAEAIKKERQALEKRQKAAQNRAERLKHYLACNMDGKPFKTSRVAISYHTSPGAVVFLDETAAANWLGEHHPEALVYSLPEISKSAVKKLIDGGEKIPGVTVDKPVSLSIK